MLPLTPQESTDDQASTYPTPTKRLPEKQRLQTFSTVELMAAEFPDDVWTVPGMLPGGLALLAGRPKIGKTWLVMDLAVSKAVGRGFLGHELDSGRVLYLALEGQPAYVQRRMHKVLAGAPAPGNLHWACDSMRLHDGLEEQLEDFLCEHPDCELVVVDTYIRVGPQRSLGRTQYEQDAAALRKMEKVAGRWPNVAFVFVHHTRELASDDPLDSMSGSRGLTGTVDTGWVLGHRANVDAKAVLAARGRHLEEDVDLALDFDPTSCCWAPKGDASKYFGGETRRQILEILEESGALGPAEVAALAGIAPSTARQTLSRMAKAGQVHRAAGKYSIEPV